MPSTDDGTAARRWRAVLALVVCIWVDGGVVAMGVAAVSGSNGNDNSPLLMSTADLNGTVVTETETVVQADPGGSSSSAGGGTGDINANATTTATPTPPSRGGGAGGVNDTATMTATGDDGSRGGGGGRADDGGNDDDGGDNLLLLMILSGASACLLGVLLAMCGCWCYMTRVLGWHLGGPGRRRVHPDDVDDYEGSDRGEASSRSCGSLRGFAGGGAADPLASRSGAFSAHGYDHSNPNGSRRESLGGSHSPLAPPLGLRMAGTPRAGDTSASHQRFLASSPVGSANGSTRRVAGTGYGARKKTWEDLEMAGGGAIYSSSPARSGSRTPSPLPSPLSGIGDAGRRVFSPRSGICETSELALIPVPPSQRSNYTSLVASSAPGRGSVDEL